MNCTLHRGDCRDAMRGMVADSIDSIVTDPPYGLSFMGKGWDHGVPGVEFWEAALRVAKPGAHLLAFGGTRTFHRLTVAIEDAGWEIRDCLMWVYGSGFPKSHDVSKGIDKMDASEEQERRRLRFTAWVRSTGVTSRQIDEATGTNMGGHYTTAASQPAIMTREHLEQCRHLLGDVPGWVEREADIRSVESRNMAEREVVGRDTKACSTSGKSALPTMGGETTYETWDITAPATDAARQWSGWGTALKPAWEPIILARKPFPGTVAANVLEHGTGALNVDGCRVEGKRWPANVIHDGSDEVVGLFPDTTSGSRKAGRHVVAGGQGRYGEFSEGDLPEVIGDSGSAARFFYCAKASKADRDEGCQHLAAIARANGNKWTNQDYRVSSGERPPSAESGPRRNHHPTVKPTELMRYLCRLVTPPGGTVLDPFAGSGSTGKAALLEGFNAILCELTDEYWPIIEARCNAVAKADRQQTLFD